MNRSHGVYCSKCRYYNTSYKPDKCNHPENRIYETIKGSYRSPPSKNDSGRKNRPDEINKDNNSTYLFIFLGKRFKNASILKCLCSLTAKLAPNHICHKKI